LASVEIVNTDEEASFASFYVASYGRVARSLIPIAGSAAEAEDLAQEAFARGLVRWRRVQTYEQPEAWVRAVAMNLALSRLRKIRNGVSAVRRLGPRAPEPDHAIKVVARQDLVQALGQLPQKQRAALILYYVCDRSIEQISDDLRMNAGTVKSSLARGRARLHQIMSADDSFDRNGAHP
jgi:RNA polymerase sigma-70 factor (ECF subfamily)